jgi:thiosulfate/3-mercaptopyruvate sulfurtransferase
MVYTWKYVCMAVALLAACMIRGCSGERSGETGVLVTTDWLQDHLNDPDLVILHSGSAEGYDSLHIPGARLIVPAHFTVNTETLYNEMPSADSLITLLRAVGVDNDSRIVLYYENSRLLSRTTRIYLVLDFLGLGERTFVLNGGLPEWMEEGRETTDLAPDFLQGDLGPVDSRKVVITANELDRQRWNHDVVVIDARTDEEYYGTPATMDEPAEGGHVESAYSLPYQEILTEDKPYLFKTDSELKNLFRKAGMDPKKVTVVYCGSGIRASVSYLAARQLHYPALLYDGSYQEWEELNLPLTGPVILPDENNKDTTNEE